MREKIYKIIDGAKEEGRNFLLELEAGEIFKLYGISIPDSILVEEDNLLIPSSEKLGFPLVMKIVSPQIIHKTDVGGVKVGIKNRDELITAYKSMIVETKEKVSGAEIRGVLLQKMAPPGAREVVLGGLRDATFGSVVMFGLGGIWVEVLKDVSFRVAPVDEKEAREMVKEIKGKKILEGIRGEKPVDFALLYKTIANFSQMLYEFPEFKEVDANPVFLYPDSLICVDARIILG
ncbi:acetate--CoA ligase family protein [Candidatus Calescamantes bacterium]|nr:acetate--CoA ligase family protein [Candidatus Calescamantes bacterium]